MLICGSATRHLASVFKCEMAEVHSLFTVLMARKNRACLPDKEEGTFIHKDFFLWGVLCLESGHCGTQAPNEESGTLCIPTALACPMLSSSSRELLSPMQQR